MRRAKAGDIVHVKSGSPFMRVLRVEGDEAECAWLAKGARREARYALDRLTVMKFDDGGPGADVVPEA